MDIMESRWRQKLFLGIGFGMDRIEIIDCRGS